MKDDVDLSVSTEDELRVMREMLEETRDQLVEASRTREAAFKVIAVLVKRAGGEIRITKEEVLNLEPGMELMESTSDVNFDGEWVIRLSVARKKGPRFR